MRNDPAALRRGNKTVLIVLGTLGGVGLFGVLCCGGLMLFGFGQFEEQVQAQLQGNPVIEEHIGTITSCDLDLGKSGEIEDPEIFVFHIQGTKGSGTVQVRSVTNAQGDNEVQGGQLRMADGTVHDLFPEKQGKNPLEGLGY